MALSSNSVQILPGIRQRRRPVSSQTKGRGIALIDQAFLRSIGRICLIAAPVFFLCCSVLAVMNISAEKSLETLEAQNYELLTTNLHLKGEKDSLASVESIGDRAKDYGLYPQEKWQRRVL